MDTRRAEELAARRGAGKGLPGTLVAAVLVLLMGSACAGGAGTGSVTTPSAFPAPSVPPQASQSTVPSATAPSPSVPSTCATLRLNSLTEEQRVGQLFLLGLENDRLGASEVDAIQRYHLGSVWFTETTGSGIAAVRQVADGVQALATDESTGGVRFYVAANQEGGRIQALRGPGFSTIPTAVEQGRLDPSTLKADAAGWGRELGSAGVNLNFAPVLDVVPLGTETVNEPIGALDREYGHSPGEVGSHGVAVLRGMTAAGVATSAKHFPGLGRVEGNTDFTADVVDTVTTADDPFLDPFRQAFRADVPMVMVALATYTKIDPEHLAVFSPAVMRLLRDDLGFRGVIVSDDLGATSAVERIPPADRAIGFLQAGGDLIIAKTVLSADPMAAAVLARSRQDPSFRALVDRAALRVLEAKRTSGLLACQG